MYFNFFSSFSGEFPGHDVSAFLLAVAACRVGDSAGVDGGEGGTGGGGDDRAGHGGGDLPGKLVHLFLTKFNNFTCFRRGLDASACSTSWIRSSWLAGGAWGAARGAARCGLCLATSLGA